MVTTNACACNCNNEDWNIVNSAKYMKAPIRIFYLRTCRERLTKCDSLLGNIFGGILYLYFIVSKGSTSEHAVVSITTLKLKCVIFKANYLITLSNGLNSKIIIVRNYVYNAGLQVALAGTLY